MGAPLNLAGKRFTRLRAIARAGKKHGKILWKCICVCGNKRKVYGGHLLTGHTKSCGCLYMERAARMGRAQRKHGYYSNEALAARHAKRHGMSGTPEYQSYCAAKSRCTNPKLKDWPSYGGRGIRFLFASFQEFYAEVGPRPAGTTLDRINNDGPYAPGNVRWSTCVEQSNNRRNSQPVMDIEEQLYPDRIF